MLMRASQDIIKKFIAYRKNVEKVTNVNPKRIIFYRGMLDPFEMLFSPLSAHMGFRWSI
jgi:hypothetical protein